MTDAELLVGINNALTRLELTELTRKGDVLNARIRVRGSRAKPKYLSCAVHDGITAAALAANIESAVPMDWIQ